MLLDNVLLSEKFRVNGYDLTTIQVDLIQMGDYTADSCAIIPMAFLLQKLIAYHVEVRSLIISLYLKDIDYSPPDRTSQAIPLTGIF